MKRIYDYLSSHTGASLAKTVTAIIGTVWILTQAIYLIFPDKPDIDIYVTVKPQKSVPANKKRKSGSVPEYLLASMSFSSKMYELRIINKGNETANKFTLFLPGSGHLDILEKGKELQAIKTSGRHEFKEIYPDLPMIVRFWPSSPISFASVEDFRGRYNNIDAEVYNGSEIRDEKRMVLVIKYENLPFYLAMFILAALGILPFGVALYARITRKLDTQKIINKKKPKKKAKKRS